MSFPDSVKAWQAAVDNNLIQGDPTYYSDPRATQEEINHALIVAILEAHGIDWQNSGDPTEPPTDPGPLPTGPLGITGNWNLHFEDTFTTFDDTAWQKRYEWTPTPINQELASFQPENVTADGTLKLTARADGAGDQPYTSGVITSYGKTFFKYGIAEARIKWPAGPGLFPAFWMLPNNHDYPPEIDIAEYGGARPDSVQVGYYPAPLDYGTYSGKQVPMPAVAGEWHTYSVEWDDTKLVFRIDGTEVHRTKLYVPTQDMYLILNLTVIGDNSWAGPVDGTTVFPATCEVDYVRVWKKADAPTTPPDTGTYTHTVEVGPNDRTITVASDTRYIMPEGRMDGGGAAHAFVSRGNIQHVMIDGIEATNYNPPTQAGVIQLAPDGNNLSGDDVIIQGVYIHDSDEVAIKTRVDNIVIRDFKIEDMGRLGLSVGHGADPTADGGHIHDGVIARCNADGKNSWGFEAGGSKFWQSTNLLVERVESFGHVGPGLWADKDNLNWTVSDCYLHDCKDAPGLFQEIGGAYTFLNNTIERCGRVGESWLWDAGIQVSSSDNGLIDNNIIKDCGHGISLVQQDRSGGAYGTHELRGNVVRYNTVTNSVASGLARADKTYDFVFTENNWYGNTYDSGHRFAMRNQWGDAAFWRGYFPDDAV